MKTLSRPYYYSSSFKMAALFTLLLGCGALLMGYFLYDASKQNFLRETEAAIESEIAHLLAVMNDEASTEQVVRYITKRTIQKTHPVYLLLSQEGKILAGNIEEIPTGMQPLKEGMLGYEWHVESSAKQMAAKIQTFPNGTRLLIARDITDLHKGYIRLKYITFFTFIFMSLVVLISFFISLFVVRRINTIASTAREIMETGDLSRRISIDSNWDDLSNLAQILNLLLEHIESLMQGIRDVSDNIAHDLRTPLTRLRNQLESMKDKKITEANMRMLLKEADQLLEIFNLLLRIATLEKATDKHVLTKVEVTDIIKDAIDLYEPLAEEKQVDIKCSFETPIFIQGNRDLLFQLFANIIDNAVKFSPEKAVVSIEVVTEGHEVTLVFADQGVGISEEEKDKVFRRFYRAETSRHTPGTGLGLSLAKAIIAMHEGQIILEANNPGLQVRLTFRTVTASR